MKLALSFFKLYPKYERQRDMIQRGVWIEPKLVMDVSSTQTPTVNSREAQNCDAKETQLRFKGILHQKNFYRLNLIFWIVMGCGIADLGRRGL